MVFEGADLRQIMNIATFRKIGLGADSLKILDKPKRNYSWTLFQIRPGIAWAVLQTVLLVTMHRATMVAMTSFNPLARR